MAGFQVIASGRFGVTTKACPPDSIRPEADPSGTALAMSCCIQMNAAPRSFKTTARRGGLANSHAEPRKQTGLFSTRVAKCPASCPSKRVQCVVEGLVVFTILSIEHDRAHQPRGSLDGVFISSVWMSSFMASAITQSKRVTHWPRASPCRRSSMARQSCWLLATGTHLMGANEPTAKPPEFISSAILSQSEWGGSWL
jgi:hypothetical protein